MGPNGKRVAFEPASSKRKTRSSSSALISPLPTNQKKRRSRSAQHELTSPPKSLLEDGPDYACRDYLSSIFEFLSYAQVINCSAVSKIWQQCAREKLDEWQIIETEQSHAVRGLKGRSPGKMRGPSSIAVLPGGELGVVDFLNRRIQVLSPRATEFSHSHSIHASDVVSTLKAGQAADGPFVGPTSAVPDGKGGLLVADNQTHTLYRLALPGHKESPAGGAVLARTGRHGREADELWDPEGLALDEDGVLYVADSGNHRIVCFSTNCGSDSCGSSSRSSDSDDELTPLRSFGSAGFGDGQLSSPFGVAVAPAHQGGHVYVADTLGNRVCVFTRAGAFVSSLGSRTHCSRTMRAPGSFNLPRSVSIVSGHLVVVEDRRLQVLTLEGHVRQVVEFGSGVDGLAPATNGVGIRVYSSPAPGKSPSSSPGAPSGEDEAGLWGVAADAQRMYVSDSRRHRLHIFKLRGR
jgi:hypothetical protein